MGRRPSLSSNEQAHVLGMLQSGLSTRRVAAIFVVAYSTMSRLMICFNATNYVNDPGRVVVPKQPRTATQPDMDTNPQGTVPSCTNSSIPLQTAAGITVSDQTILNRLRTAGLSAQRPVVCIFLNNVTG